MIKGSIAVLRSVTATLIVLMNSFLGGSWSGGSSKFIRLPLQPVRWGHAQARIYTVQAKAACWAMAKARVEAQKLETQWPRSLRVMYRESQHYLALIRFPTLWGLL